MADLTSYVFHSIWHVDAPSDDLYLVLCDFETYPHWWPEVRAVHRIDDRSFETVCRAALPYELRFVTALGRHDRASRTIEGRLSGDLDGFSRWVVEDRDGGSRLVYDQEVVTHKRLLNVLAPIARPVFKANHTLMMRHGEAGLRTFMAGYQRGRTGSG